MKDALEWIEEFLGNNSVVLLEPSHASMNQTLAWMRKFNLGPKRILDTHLGQFYIPRT
jgi:hypothetical protein